MLVIYLVDIMMLNLIKVKLLRGGEAREFGGEAPPPHWMKPCTVTTIFNCGIDLNCYIPCLEIWLYPSLQSFL